MTDIVLGALHPSPESRTLAKAAKAFGQVEPSTDFQPPSVPVWFTGSVMFVYDSGVLKRMVCYQDAPPRD